MEMKAEGKSAEESQGDPPVSSPLLVQVLNVDRKEKKSTFLEHCAAPVCLVDVMLHRLRDSVLLAPLPSLR